ncbi:MAG: class I SAM-dependent methyltransferase, partial [Parcubacteria group bacterium]
DYLKKNKKWWNEVVPIHAKSELYNLADFKKGKSSLQQIEIKELGNVKGKSILHFLCHFGMDSLSLARLGAKVTGIDLSNKAIDFAKQLSSETKIPAEFICSDVYKLPKILNKKYDIIFASYGTLCWLSDMKKFVKTINSFLKKDGIFYIVDLHPFTNILDSSLKFSYDYFDKTASEDDSSGTYANWDADINGSTYLWGYTIGGIINNLVAKGLKIEYLHEFPFAMYNQFPGLMKKNKIGQYVLKNTQIQIPLLFSLKAVKPRV